MRQTHSLHILEELNILIVYSFRGWKWMWNNNNNKNCIHGQKCMWMLHAEIKLLKAFAELHIYEETDNSWATKWDDVASLFDVFYVTYKSSQNIINISIIPSLFFGACCSFCIFPPLKPFNYQIAQLFKDLLVQKLFATLINMYIISNLSFVLPMTNFCHIRFMLGLTTASVYSKKNQHKWVACECQSTDSAVLIRPSLLDRWNCSIRSIQQFCIHVWSKGK